MFWADRIAGDIEETRAKQAAGKPLIIRDEKTLSGRVHIGSMRGLAIHGLVSEVLAERGIENRFLWEHNDFDPLDTVPGYPMPRSSPSTSGSRSIWCLRPSRDSRTTRNTSARNS
jgi:lysyl-tRNA synthetase class I